MQETLFRTEAPSLDLAYIRVAIRECIEYGEHGIDIEQDDAGRPVCFNCQGKL